MRLERMKKMVDARFVDQARRDLASLLSLHPELEEDDVLRQDMIEAETGANRSRQTKGCHNRR
jgi:hypothetical protein